MGQNHASCIFWLLYLTLVIAKDMYTLDVYRITCGEADPRFVQNISCSTRRINRTHRAHSLLGFLLPNMMFDDIYVKVDYSQKTRSSYGRSLISAEENFCGFLAGTSKSLLIKLLWPLVKQTSNLHGKCPFKDLINITDFIFDDSSFPPYLPEGLSRLDIHVRNGPKCYSLGKVYLYIEIKPKGAFKLVF